VDRLRESLADAEQTLQAARAGAEPTRAEREKERELRAVKARIEDQAGEIARLKAALATFEQADQAETGLRNSRLALKARAGSAEAQAERQAATITKLRAELAAANERLAQQAAHFMDEMRRLGSGTAPPSGQARRAGRDEQRRRLAERVAQVPAASEPAGGAHNPAASNGKGAASAAPEAMPSQAAFQGPPPPTPSAPPQPVAEAAVHNEPQSAKAPPADLPPPAAPAAAEMPQTAAIPEARRRMRLLDRITGLGKA
jgi:hypothetical protein